MNKNELAQQINCEADLARTIRTNYELEFVEDEIYDNQNKVESWTDRENSQKSFIPENDGSYVYVLYCDNVPCHKVDYNNTEECDILGATDCESEAECLVSANTRMRITYVSTEDDFKEMGYYTVEMELINE